MLQRHHLFEFCDQPWLKGWLRETHLDCLTLVHSLFKPYRRMPGALAQAVASLNADEILDLASGNAEHISFILTHAQQEGVQLPKIVVSDIFSVIHEYEKIKKQFGEKAFDFINHPLSATDLPPSESRLLSIFTAFHHFPPDAAKKILAAALENGKGIIIFELARRRWLDLLIPLTAVPLYMLAPLFAARPSLLKTLFTTFIPLAPLMVAWDCFVSVLRVYTPEEIISMIEGMGITGITYEYGERHWFLESLKSTYIFIKRAG